MSTTRHTTLLQTRHVMVTLAVLATHATLLWLMQTAQENQPSEEFVIPARVVMEMVQPRSPQEPAAAVAQLPPNPGQNARPVTPEPRPTQPRPAPDVPTAPTVQAASSTVIAPVPAHQAAPSALAVPTEIAASSGNVGVSTPEKARTAPSAPPAAPAAPRIELPSSDADYLNNPKPRYPGRSKSRGEEGTVLVRLFVDVDGSVSNAGIEVSSGYVLLDRAGLQAASHWKYVPGKRDGVPVPMWVTVPIKFQLTDK